MLRCPRPRPRHLAPLRSSSLRSAAKCAPRCATKISQKNTSLNPNCINAILMENELVVNTKNRKTAMDNIKWCFRYVFYANSVAVICEAVCRISGWEKCSDTSEPLLQTMSSMNDLFAVLAACMVAIVIGKPIGEKIAEYLDKRI